MKAGRELDALVAEKVMGWKVLSHWDADGGIKHLVDHNQCEVRPAEFKPYSTDISAAWEVVEKLQSEGFHACVHRYVQKNPHWGAQFDKEDLDVICGPTQGAAPTAPHAICLAALKTVGALG